MLKVSLGILQALQTEFYENDFFFAFYYFTLINP